MKIEKPGRRSLLARVSALFGVAVLSRAGHAALKQTPGAAEGPFYPAPTMRYPDIDNDLVKVEGVVKESGGEIVTLKGVVSNKHGAVLSGARVEIWQCDINGKYLHTGDSQNLPHDPAFQGYGHDITNLQGEYSFRTIKPAEYPGRTRHIHVKVLNGEQELLTTQFYVEGEPNNRKDGIYRRLSGSEAEAVSMRFVENNGTTEAVVNIVV